MRWEWVVIWLIIGEVLLGLTMMHPKFATEMADWQADVVKHHQFSERGAFNIGVIAMILIVLIWPFIVYHIIKGIIKAFRKE